MEIGKLSAQALAAQIATGKLSSYEATTYFIERIKTHNGSLNAIITDRFEEALSEAKAADEAQMAGNIGGALHGVPMTVKDAFEVKGLTACVGAPQWANTISQADSAVVERLKAAGAIILGKTNTPLFCGDWQSYNEVYGTTNNPFNLAHTPGGSSGGSAAALAAGMTPLEYGSDIGGSIRIPASYCGLFGHKPTYGIIPKRGHVPPTHGARAETELSVVGPLARSVGDLELALDLTIGLEAPQNHALQLKLPAPRATTPQDLRVGIWADDPYCPVDSEVVAAIEAAGEKLGQAGAQVRTIKPSFSFEHHTETYLMLMAPIIARSFPDEAIAGLKTLVDAASPDDKSLAMLQARGSLLSYREWQDWNEARAQMAAQWQALFQDIDVLLCPTTPTPAMPHTQSAAFAQRRIMVNGKERIYAENLVWAGLPILCELPATAVPLTLHSTGLPMGMQIIGPAYEDKTPIGVARMLEGMGYHAHTPPDYN